MVRATFSGFNTALSALQANQKRLDITGQNLSNMNTAGYTRQQLEASSLNYTNPVSHYSNGNETAVGFGVSMDRVSQIRDPYLDIQYRNQSADCSYTNRLQTALNSLSKVLDETTISGIRKAFDDVQSTLTSMQDPAKVSDPIYESELRTKMQSVCNLFNQASRQITQAEQNEFQRLTGEGSSEQGDVQKINDILRQIGDLNVQIKRNQVAGHPSLELQDERNLLLDELSGYIPIETRYYKDDAHSGNNAYDYDANGAVIGKKDWPDDLEVSMDYIDAQGKSQKLILVNGSDLGANGLTKNYGQLSVLKGDHQTAASVSDPADISIKFEKAPSYKGNGPAATNDVYAELKGIRFEGGSLQASLDMLQKTGTGKVINGSTAVDDVRGYQYYSEKLDQLASTFAKSMNDINNGKNHTDQNLLSNSTNDSTTGITAGNIGISKGWTSGTIHISTDGTNRTDTILDMIAAMKDTTKLNGKTFADYMNNLSTQLASDSSSNQTVLKTGTTVLNSILDSRDSLSGVSLDEEATNMMAYVSAYNAASRLMTALDEVLNTLISNTGA
ncbi:flagellar basal body protein [Clostridium sp. AT4]|uniref:flagellar hook-associated protein FlgK n=1 Tax=Clostridia TaxID=186801 RepID=UPI00082E765F|nr:flagellar basal body protein [Clostridium sp. AT4]